MSSLSNSTTLHMVIFAYCCYSVASLIIITIYFIVWLHSQLEKIIGKLCKSTYFNSYKLRGLWQVKWRELERAAYNIVSHKKAPSLY